MVSGERATVLVVDGGQSSTVALVADTDGTVSGCGFGGPVNHVAARLGRQRMWDALSAAVGGARRSVEPPVPSVDLAYLGLTGGLELARELLPRLLPTGRIVAESDAVAALASGTRGGPGVGLIAGTGVVAVGVTPTGERVVRGGWGYLAGDAGSGYWTGMEAVRCAARAEDGILARGALHEAVCAHFSVPDVRELVRLLYSEQIERPRCAQLAPAVFALAEAGDPIAADIVARGATALADLAAATVRAVPDMPPEHRVVVLGGGLMRPGGLLHRELVPRVARSAPGWRVEVTERPPVVGGLFLALRLLGREVDHGTLRRVDASLDRFPQVRTKTTDEVRERDGGPSREFA